MKTYKNVATFLMALSFVSCDTSSEEISSEFPTNTSSNYTVISKQNNRLNTQVLGSTEDGMFLKNDVTAFMEIPSSSLKYRTAERISFYATENCESTVQVYNTLTDTTLVLDVFTDLDVCSIEVTAIAHTSEYVFLSYSRELEGKERQFMVRFVSLTTNTPTFMDIALDKKPVDLVPSSNSVFILTMNEFVTNEFHLQVIEVESKESLIELDLGYDATKLFKNKLEEVIISYPELHTTLNPITFDKKYTMYGENTAPGFLTTTDYFMDSYGRLYFQKTIPEATIETVPAIYDFEKNNTVVYLFENFLSETELNVRYNIATTTSIGYDEQNDYLLIGYQKNGQQDTGGILRISPAPDFKVIDQIDLEGVPQTIFVN